MPVIACLCAIYTDCKNNLFSYIFAEVESIFRIAVASVCAVFSHLDCDRVGRIQVNYLNTELERVGSGSIVRTHIQGHNLVVRCDKLLAVSEGIEMIQVCRFLSILVVIDDTQSAALVLIFIITYICKGSHESAAPVDSSAAVAFSSAVIIGVPPVCIHEVCLGEARKNFPASESNVRNRADTIDKHVGRNFFGYRAIIRLGDGKGITFENKFFELVNTVGTGCDISSVTNTYRSAGKRSRTVLRIKHFSGNDRRSKLHDRIEHGFAVFK